MLVQKKAIWVLEILRSPSEKKGFEIQLIKITLNGSEVKKYGLKSRFSEISYEDFNPKFLLSSMIVDPFENLLISFSGENKFTLFDPVSEQLKTDSIITQYLSKKGLKAEYFDFYKDQNNNLIVKAFTGTTKNSEGSEIKNFDFLKPG